MVVVEDEEIVVEEVVVEVVEVEEVDVVEVVDDEEVVVEVVLQPSIPEVRSNRMQIEITSILFGTISTSLL